MISIQVYFIHCCFKFCLNSFNFQLISWEVTFCFCDRSHLLGRSFAETFLKAPNLLRKRTIAPPLGDRSPSRENVSHDLFRSLFPLSPITLTTMLHLIVLGGSINFFFRTCVFGYKFGGRIYPHLLTQVLLYPSPHFSVLYIHWGQCMIQVWGYERHIYTHLSCF
jgi:hypothetical protein